MPEVIDTREGWLEDALERLRPDFQEKHTPLPETVRVSMGFPSRHALGRRNRAIGQCWDGAATEDQIAQVYVSPILDDPFQVLEVLVHELVHAAVGCTHGHKAPFKHGAERMGLEGKPTSTHAGPALSVRLRDLAAELGDLPHTKLTPTAPDAKQTTRLLKVECADCSYICRVTRKILDAMDTPICPSCEAPMAEADAPADA